MLDLLKDSVTLSAFFLTVSNHLGSQALDLFQFVILVSYEMFWLACPTIYELILVSVGPERVRTLTDTKVNLVPNK